MASDFIDVREYLDEIQSGALFENMETRTRAGHAEGKTWSFLQKVERKSGLSYFVSHSYCFIFPHRDAVLGFHCPITCPIGH